ncbi:hypothetical protein M758_2G063800 [Ceratodon purpureus]|nr:hypothetical protein M758_2G063800 [Ceratodon purpureus]
MSNNLLMQCAHKDDTLKTTANFESEYQPSLLHSERGSETPMAQVALHHHESHHTSKHRMKPAHVARIIYHALLVCNLKASIWPPE